MRPANTCAGIFDESFVSQRVSSCLDSARRLSSHQSKSLYTPPAQATQSVESDKKGICYSPVQNFHFSHRNLRLVYNQPCIDRKSTRLNSSHLGISYAVFCLK